MEINERKNEKIYKSTITVGDFKSLLLIMNQQLERKKSKALKNWNNTN